MIYAEAENATKITKYNRAKKQTLARTNSENDSVQITSLLCECNTGFT